MKWVRDRVLDLRTVDSYQPRLHFDCYGTIGEAFANDIDQVATYLSHLCEISAPLALRIEHPLDAGSRQGQIIQMSSLRRVLSERGINVELVVDELCNTLEDMAAFVSNAAADVIHVKMPDLGGINNTIEALLLVRARDLKAYCGGAARRPNVPRKSAHTSPWPARPTKFSPSRAWESTRDCRLWVMRWHALRRWWLCADGVTSPYCEQDAGP